MQITRRSEMMMRRMPMAMSMSMMMRAHFSAVREFRS
jgi:hypothetical protein